jgi:catechol 2,3-dioxygenase-like lactoylglutathione lyase family enzyme
MVKLNKLTKVKEFRLKIYTNKLTEMKSFYEDLMEFPVIKEWDRGEDDKGFMFDTGNSIIELFLPEKEYKPIQGCDISLEVKDVWKLWDKMKDGDDVIFALRDNKWGDTSFCISDPEGLNITFFSKTK